MSFQQTTWKFLETWGCLKPPKVWDAEISFTFKLCLLKCRGTWLLWQCVLKQHLGKQEKVGREESNWKNVHIQSLWSYNRKNQGPRGYVTSQRSVRRTGPQISWQHGAAVSVITARLCPLFLCADHWPWLGLYWTFCMLLTSSDLHWTSAGHRHGRVLGGWRE